MPIIKYHYTSLDAMKSILEGKQWRLTRSEFLNDPKDCKVLQDLIEKYTTDAVIEQAVSDVIRDKKCSTEAAQEKAKGSLSRLYQKAPLEKYIAYLQRHIPLYILSFTGNNDKLPMWNYYGSGGVQLNINITQLMEILFRRLNGENEYYAYSDVKYIAPSDEVGDITFAAPDTDGTLAGSFQLDGEGEQDILRKNREEFGGKAGAPYNTRTLKEFLDKYIRDYIFSLDYWWLRTENDARKSASAEEIFKAIYENTLSMGVAGTTQDWMRWKKDMTLYSIVLSALIKKDTYQFEKEFRVVFFHSSLDSPIQEECQAYSLHGQKYLRPYITKDTQAPAEMADGRFVTGIALSPLTRNLPIDAELYLEIVKNFAENKLGHEVEITWSNHELRN